MAWQAKPSGGYAVNSSEWKSNLDEINTYLSSQGWTLEAICGACGNFQAESGMNPWRWQSDSVSLTSKVKGYGICQWTPAYGYINDYGKGVDGYSPNLSVTQVTQGATPEDGHAQLIVIDTNKSGKFINRTSYCKYADISGLYPLSDYKQSTDLWLTTVGWLFHFEFPADRSISVAQARYRNSQACYEYLKGSEPPDPPDPPDPPEPPTGLKRAKLPIYMYPIYRRKIWQ